MKLHSVVDLITNSSQEIFILPTEKSEAEVETLLREKWADLSPDAFPFTVTKSPIGYRSLNKHEKIEGCSHILPYDGEWHAWIEYNIGDVIVTAGYYWGFGGCPTERSFEEEFSEQEKFEKVLEENFPGWTSTQVG